jgi:hypothetical protein
MAAVIDSLVTDIRSTKHQYWHVNKDRPYCVYREQRKCLPMRFSKVEEMIA